MILLDLFYQLVEAIVLIVGELGYLGIFLGMTVESSLLPFPSEIILIPAGALAAGGEMNVIIIFLAALAGCLLGALINYYLALWLGRTTVEFLVKKYGKVLLIDKKGLKKADVFFHKHGDVTTFVGRLIPMIRQLISLPAGFSRMHLGKFLFFTGLGAGLWSAILIWIGYLFGNNLSWVSAHKNMLTMLMGLFSLSTLMAYVIWRKRSAAKAVS